MFFLILEVMLNMHSMIWEWASREGSSIGLKI